mgnify:CR=1 FL=1
MCNVRSPNLRGAVKRTTLPGEWAHIACAYWLNDVGFLNPLTLEPICSVIDGHKGCISNVLPGTPGYLRYQAHLERLVLGFRVTVSVAVSGGQRV